MEPLVPPDVPTATSSDPREQIDEVLRGRVDRSDIDVRTFLLDPPPTDLELARTARRRMFVRRGSVAVAAIVAVLLVAPWPSGGADQDPGPLADPASDESFHEPAVEAASRAVRLDVEPARQRRSPLPLPRPGTARRIASTTPVRATTTPLRNAVATPSAAAPHPVGQPAPEPGRQSVSQPAPRPAAPPAPGAGDAILAPVL